MKGACRGILLFLLIVSCCGCHRSPASSPDALPQDGTVLIPPDALPRDALRLDSMGPCSPPGYADNLVIMGHKTGDWTVALAPRTLYSPLKIINPLPRQAVATVSYRQGVDVVEGFVISNPTKASDVAHEVAGAIKLIKARFPKATVESEGRRITTHDGFAAMEHVTLTVAGNQCESGFRNDVLMALLAIPMSRLVGLPSSSNSNSQLARTIRLTVVLRNDGRALFLGSVTEQARDLDLSRQTGTLAEDLTGANGLATHGSTLAWSCETLPRNRPGSNLVDFIWIMDDGTNMYGERKKVAAQAETFFNQALASGLDFRMGITGMNKPGGSYKALVGRFCSRPSTDKKDSGGEDRFVGATERTRFTGCLTNPPGRELNFPHGLHNALEAVKSHLPRSSLKWDKIRTEARVVIIAVTSAVPASLRKTITDQNLTSCALPAKTQAELNKEIAPLIGELGGSNKPEARIHAFHALAGICNNNCKHHVAHGYNEVAKALGGQVHSLCSTNLDSHVGKIISGAAAGSGVVQLKHEPVSASLRVALNGAALERNPAGGFDYVPVKQGLTFSGISAWPAGSTIAVSYARWR